MSFLKKLRKKRFFFVFLLLISIGIIPFVGYQKQSYKNKIISYTLEGRKLKLLVADTPTEHEKGLMFYRKIDGVDGMIFIFPEKLYRGFWNKNTLMDLDLYWIADKKVVGKSFLPSIEKSKDIITVASPEAVDIVIEIPIYKNQ